MAGNVTRGSYRLLLPDGRTEIVDFMADESGYHAEVKYEESGSAVAGVNGSSPVTAKP